MDVPSGNATLGINVTQSGVTETTAGLNSLTDAASNLTKAQAQIVAMMQAVKTELASTTAITLEQANAMRQEMATIQGVAAATGNLGLVEKDLLATQAALTASTAALAGGMTEAGAAAAASTIGFDTAGAGLGRLRYSLTSAADSALGIPPILGRVASSLGVIGAGLGPVLAITAAVAVLAGTWELLTKDSRDAQEQQDKLTASLDKWYEKQQEGPAGELPAQIDAVTKQIVQLQTIIANGTPSIGEYFKAIGAGLVASFQSFSPTAFTDATEAAFKQYYLKQIAAIQTGTEQRDAAMAEANKRLSAAFLTEQSTIASALSSIISSGNASSGVYGAAQGQIGIDQSLLAGFQAKLGTLSPGGDTATSHPYADTAKDIEGLTADIKKLQDALQALTPAQKAVLDANTALIQGINDQRAVDDAYGATLKGVHDNLATLGFDITGPIVDLTAMKNALTADENALNDFTRQGLADYSAGLDKTHDRAQKATEDAQRLSETIGHDLVKAFDDLAKHGSLSFTTLIDDATNLAYHISDLLQKHAAAQAIANGGSSADAAAAAKSAGLSSGDVNTLGTFSVAAQGVQLVASSLNNLLHIAPPTADAMEKFVQDVIAVQKSLAAYALSVNGGSVAQALAGNTNTADTLRDSINQDFGGKHNQTYREGLLSQVDTTQAQAAAKISQTFWEGITASINATEGPAGAYKNQLQALNSSYADNLKSAGALNATTEQVQEITDLYDKSLAALNAAYQEGLKQTQYSLDARQAYALGLTAEGDAITRQAQEEKEISDAKAADYTDAQIQQLKYIQGLEDEAAAKKRVTDATSTYVSAVAGGPNGNAATTALGDLAPLLQKYADDQAAYNQAVADDLDPLDLFALQVGLAADAATIAAKAWSDAVAAMTAGTSDIERDVAGGFITGTQGLANERQNFFGDANLSDDAIKAMYVPWYPGITNAEAQTDANITAYFQDEGKWAGGAAGAVAAAAASVDTFNRTTTGTVSSISDAQANGVIGRIDTSNMWLESIDNKMSELIDGGVTAVFSASDPRTVAGLDAANGRGLNRLRAGVGGTRA